MARRINIPLLKSQYIRNLNPKPFLSKVNLTAVMEDISIRNFLKKELPTVDISTIEIERPINNKGKVKIILSTKQKPSMVERKIKNFIKEFKKFAKKDISVKIKNGDQKSFLSQSLKIDPSSKTKTSTTERKTTKVLFPKFIKQKEKRRF